MSTEPTAARVISKDGNVSTGWVINGQTFKDQGGIQRIDSGSTVELNDGRSWVYNDKTGGVPTAQTTRNNYANTTDYSSYDNALNTMQSGIDSRASAQRAAYNRQADKIRRDAEIAKKEAREAYIQASNPYGPIGQRLEALGLGDSGYAETTYARLGNQYQKLLSDQARATEDALAGIYGDIEAAYAQADYDRAMAAANIMLQKDSAKRSDNQFLANMDLTNSQNAIANNQYDQSRQDQLNRYAIEDARYDAEKAYQQRYDALALIMSGYIDEPTAKAAGMTEAEAMARYRQYLANQPVTTRSSGGGSSGGKKSSSNKSTQAIGKIKGAEGKDLFEEYNNFTRELDGSSDDALKLMARLYDVSDEEMKLAIKEAQGRRADDQDFYPIAGEETFWDENSEGKWILGQSGDWAYVPGMGRLSKSELEAEIKAGNVIAKYTADGKVYYTKA